ncbi:hypothetical protein ASD79_12145 [Caulobacter sp. Root655]|uniref:DUF2141 domain-containing protein n=1 Tax=Caulobacter sp. Root655 TaxID=1736578 RepID=UPI0006FB03E1|nr:DUF2141 domain-containing protein [Caulobacter sp. Root655]KRA59420.1 hypothetical protein ASD79_12145 [Caulobacter sp. Root655]
MEVRSALFAVAVAGFAAMAGSSSAAESDGVASRGGDCEGRPTGMKLIVQVGQLRSNQGEVAVTLYPSDSHRFMAPRGKLMRARVRTTAPVTQVCFYLPRPDAYAVAVYHDTNANHDFDRNAVGLPGEGYGFSNDAPTKFGVPTFEAARFRTGSDNITLRIRMRYPR